MDVVYKHAALLLFVNKQRRWAHYFGTLQVVRPFLRWSGTISLPGFKKFGKTLCFKWSLPLMTYFWIFECRTIVWYFTKREGEHKWCHFHLTETVPAQPLQLFKVYIPIQILWYLLELIHSMLNSNGAMSPLRSEKPEYTRFQNLKWTVDDY